VGKIGSRDPIGEKFVDLLNLRVVGERGEVSLDGSSVTTNGRSGEATGIVVL